MADDRRIVIELKVSSGDGGEEKTTAEKEFEKANRLLASKLQIIQNPIGTIESSLLKKATNGKPQLANYVLGQTKELSKKAITYFLGRYYNLTENYKAEQTIDNVMSCVNHVESILGTIGAGAIAGAQVGGGYGAIFGAALGVVFATTNTVIDTIKAFDQEDINLATMKIQSSYQKARLGLIDDGRGTQN